MAVLYALVFPSVAVLMVRALVFGAYVRAPDFWKLLCGFWGFGFRVPLPYGAEDVPGGRS